MFIINMQLSECGFHFLFLGAACDAPVHADIQLVFGQHLLPHDDRQLGARLETALRNVSRL